jgi:hypothetical protein
VLLKYNGLGQLLKPFLDEASDKWEIHRIGKGLKFTANRQQISAPAPSPIAMQVVKLNLENNWGNPSPNWSIVGNLNIFEFIFKIIIKNLPTLNIMEPMPTFGLADKCAKILTFPLAIPSAWN